MKRSLVFAILMGLAAVACDPVKTTGDVPTDVVVEVVEDVLADVVADVPTDTADLTDLAGPGEPCVSGGNDCRPGLVCCYPCGIPGCDWECTEPCDAGEPACSNGCLMYP
jgi:hypothetical protein